MSDAILLSKKYSEPDATDPDHAIRHKRLSSDSKVDSKSDEGEDWSSYSQMQRDKLRET